jgi:diaminopimelate decarboxylase
MDVFNERLPLDEAARIVQAALNRKLLNPAPAVVIHHLGRMRARIGELQRAFPKTCLHTIAIKANPIVELLREIVRMDLGLEAASIEEVALALAAGCPAARIVYDSPAKTFEEIRQALAWGVYLNADNFDELDRIAVERSKAISRSLIGLRINTMVGGGAIEHTSVSAANSKFGVPLGTDRGAIVAAFSHHRWLNGLHVHVGSQGCRLELLVEAAVRAADVRREIIGCTGRTVSHVDIGGGLPTTYRSLDVAPTPAEYRALLERSAPDLFGGDVRLITEFGRAIHANCGIAVSRVEYVKPAQRLAVIHLGADFLLRPVYRPEEWQLELFVLDRHGRPKVGTPQAVTIAGPLCFAGDIVSRNVMLPPIEVGDWIVIRDSGAYTLSMWSRHCNRGIPAVIGFDPDAGAPFRILRYAESVEHIVRFWSRGGGRGRASSAGSAGAIEFDAMDGRCQAVFPSLP